MNKFLGQFSGGNGRHPPEAVLKGWSVAGLCLDHVTDDTAQLAVQRLAKLGVSAVGVLEWWDVLDTVAALVYGP